MSLVDITKPLLPTALSSSTVDKLGQHQKNFRKARIQTHDSWVGSANATSVLCRPPPPPPKLQWSFPGSAIRVKKTVSSFSVQLFLHRKTSQKVFFYFLMNFSTFIFFPVWHSPAALTKKTFKSARIYLILFWNRFKLEGPRCNWGSIILLGLARYQRLADPTKLAKISKKEPLDNSSLIFLR